MVLVDIIFIHDVSDDFFENILHGNKPRSLSVLVDDDHHLCLRALHLTEKVINALGFGNINGITQNLAKRTDRLAGVLRMQFLILHRVPEMHNSFDVIYIADIDGESRVVLLQHKHNRVTKRCIRVNRDHVVSVRHDIPGFLVGKLEDIRDHLRFGLLDDALLMALVHHGTDFLLGHIAGKRLSSDAEHKKDSSRDSADNADQWKQHGKQQAEYTAKTPDPFIRRRSRKPFRKLYAKDFDNNKKYADCENEAEQIRPSCGCRQFLCRSRDKTSSCRQIDQSGYGRHRIHIIRLVIQNFSDDASVFRLVTAGLRFLRSNLRSERPKRRAEAIDYDIQK